MRSEQWDVYCIRVVRGIFLKVPGDLGIPWPLWCWIPGKVDQDNGSDLILSAVAAALRRRMQPCNHVTSSQIAFPWERVGSQVCVKFWQDSERKTYLPISGLYDIYTPLGPAGLRRPQSSCFAKFFSLSPFWSHWMEILHNMGIDTGQTSHIKENTCNNMSTGFKTSLSQEINFYDFIKMYYFVLTSKLSTFVGQNLV